VGAQGSTVLDRPVSRGDGPKPTSRKLGVLLAIFDFPVLNVGFRAAIDDEPDMEVVGEVSSPESVRAALDARAPDVVIAECSPYNGHGRMTIEAIRAARPTARILALECRSGSEQFSLALKAGADGFLTRGADSADVVSAIRCISGGQTYVSPAIVTKMVNTYLLGSPNEISDPYDTLSEREREVLLLAALGHTNREIAKMFHLSEQTIHNYRAGLMEKLGFHDRVELLKYAIRRGFISVADL